MTILSRLPSRLAAAVSALVLATVLIGGTVATPDRAYAQAAPLKPAAATAHGTAHSTYVGVIA